MNNTPEERAAAFYADQIKRTGSKVLHLFPKRGPNAASTLTRILVLRRLVGAPGYIPGSLNRILQVLEDRARDQGFQIVEVDPADYDPKVYRHELA